MKRYAVPTLLQTHKPLLARQFGVTDLAVFGSTVRDDARPDRNIDILVSFDGPATSSGVSSSLHAIASYMPTSVSTKMRFGSLSKMIFLLRSRTECYQRRVAQMPAGEHI